jgi:dCMP deaminase
VSDLEDREVVFKRRPMPARLRHFAHMLFTSQLLPDCMYDVTAVAVALEVAADELEESGEYPLGPYHIHGPWKSRPSWDEYWLLIAKAVSTRSACTRRKVGAVLVKNNRIVSTGYNGPPSGDKECAELPCPRSQSDVAPGPPYSEGPGRCIAIHAEANVLLYTQGRASVEGAILYITHEPCFDCLKLIRGAGVIRIVHPEGAGEQDYEIRNISKEGNA